MEDGRRTPGSTGGSGLSVHWPIVRSLLARSRVGLITDDFRAYKGYELLAAAMHAASALDRVGASAHVGIMLPTSGLFPIAALGAWMTGRVVVPLNYLLSAEELAYVIDDADTDTVVTATKLLEHTGHAPDAANLIKLDEIDFARAPRPRIPKTAPDAALAALVYTSGTSGRPKGVMLSHGALLANARQGGEHMGVRKSDRFLGVLPQFHCYGLTQLTITPLYYGVPVTYAARFSPTRILELVERDAATVMVAIPAMLNALASLKSAGPDRVRTLRLIVSGSEKLPRGVAEKFERVFGLPIREGYGMTEMGPATHCCVEGREKPGTVGPPLPGVRQCVARPGTDERLPAGEAGEVRLNGPNRMTGYYKLPDLTAEALDPDGFYKTGDQGIIDGDGYLTITGRLKEMLIIGGENVFPREIEEVLDAHEAVHASAVVGRPDDVRGEVPVAFVEIEEGHGFDETALRAYCREHLAGYKVPRDIATIDELPRSATGKILRRELGRHGERSADDGSGDLDWPSTQASERAGETATETQAPEAPEAPGADGHDAVC